MKNNAEKENLLITVRIFASVQQPKLDNSLKIRKKVIKSTHFYLPFLTSNAFDGF